MASCTDLNKLSSTIDYQSTMKATPVSILSSKKFVDPFTRLKNRANLFRRKNYSSQIDISNPRSSLPADHFIPYDQLSSPTTNTENSNLVLKRSNSMICPQQRIPSLLKSINHHHQRNSICVQLPGCSSGESSTDDFKFLKSSSNRYWNKKMSNIKEQDIFPSDESLHEKKPEEDKSSILPTPQRQSFDEPFYDCKQQNIDLSSSSASKMSTSTMTGKSLNNLDECLSSTSSEDKGVQTTFNESAAKNSCVKRTNSSTSLSSSTTSIQTDSLENKPKHTCQLKTHDKWPYSSLKEQTCIYWVNYLGSTAIKTLNENSSTIPTHAINRLKLSTQYARILPIIGLSISSRGVEFLKHTKDRIVICFHDIKSIHCACQDQDLRYFAYVTHEQRLINGMSNSTIQPLSSPILSTNGEYHNYCHVFVVKNESMSTEILLNFGRSFDAAYRLHHRLNSKKDVNHLPKKSNKMISSLTHSPGTSSSSSSTSIDERRVFV